MLMFALVVRFNIRDEESAIRFDELTAEVLEHIKTHEPGTLVYATSAVEGEPLARVFYEVYADREHAFEAHEVAPYVVEFHARKNPLLVGHRVEFLTPGLAKGLPVS
jgi:quinol monooxygenase YgiN